MFKPNYKSYIKPNKFFQFLKLIYRNFFLNTNQSPVLVASIGRSGSTLLYDAVSKSAANILNISDERLARSLKCESWDLSKRDKFINGCVYKTHDFPYKHINSKKLKILYVHDKPSNIIISVNNQIAKEGINWLEHHLYNLRSKKDPAFFLKEEIFDIKNHLIKWKEYKGANILFVGYEDLWQRKGDIEEFLGYTVDLPKKKERKSTLNCSASKLKEIREFYKDEDELYERLYT